MIGEAGTLVGMIISFVSLIFSFNLYFKTRKSKSIWTEFGEMFFTVSFLILLLSLTILLYLILHTELILWVEVIIVLLLPITVFYFYSTVIKIFKEFLGVDE